MITNEYATGPTTGTPRIPTSEVGRLAAWLGQAQAGHSQVILVTGGLGSGKSTFLNAARGEARARSFRVGDLVLPGPSVVVARGDDGDGDKRSVAVARGLTGLRELFRLARLSAERWLIVMDDAHRQDAEEVAAIVRLVLSTDTTGVVLLLGAAEGHESAGGRLTRLSAQLATIPGTNQHRLGPWTGLDVHDLILEPMPGIPPAVRFGFEVAQVTGGNPALIRAYADMAAALPEDERLTVVSGARRLLDLAPPPLADQLVHARTAALAGGARRVVQTLALWGLPADAELVAELADLPRAAAVSILDRLEDEEHVRLRPPDEDDDGAPEFDLPDPVTGGVLARAAPSLLAQGVRQRASAILEARELAPAAQIVRAQHHLAVGDLTQRRAEQVVEAALLLLHRGRWASARSFLEPVVWAAVEDDLPSDVLVEAVRALAETYHRGGDSRTAERLIEATRPRVGAPAPGYLVSLQRLATGWAGVGRELEAETTHRYVAAHPSTARTTRIASFSELVRLRHWSGHPEEAIALASYAREVHRGEPDAEASLWFQQALVLRMQGHPADSLDAARNAYTLARAAGERGATARALVAIGEAWLDSESADRAVLWMRGGLRRAERAQSFNDVAWTRNRMIPAYIEAGDWANAELAARRGLSFAASLNLPQTLRRSETALALIQALRGRVWTEFLRTRVTSSDMANPLITTAVMTALYEQQRLAGQSTHARYTILQAAEMLDGRRGWERLLELEVLPRLAANHAEHGDEAGLAEVTRRFAGLAESSSFTLPISRLELMMAQARQALLQDRPVEASTLLELARSGYQGMHYRWRWAQVAGILGQAYARSGRRARAIETLRSGYLALERLGARPEAGRLRAEIQMLGAKAPRVRARSSAALTPKQMEVAILAARGLTDREIARELGTTRRTTTTHMHAILKRLGLRSRLEIAEWLQRGDALPRA